jgi:predicted DNA-binding transcriptional regulator AlpA
MPETELIIPVDDRVISYPEAAKSAGISECTLRRRINAGTGPRTVRLSARRVGIRVRDFRTWLESNTQEPLAELKTANDTPSESRP